MAINRQQRAADRLRERQELAAHRAEQTRINAEAEASGAGGVRFTDNRNTEPRTIAGKSLAGPTENKSGDVNATDAAIALARESKIDLRSVKGTGEGGRITKADVQTAVDAG